MWGHGVRNLALAALLAAVAPPAAAEEFEVGNWLGEAVHDKHGDFQACEIWAEYDGDITIYFTVFRDYEWSITFRNPDWNLVEGREVKTALLIDNYAPIVVRAQVVGKTQISARLQNSDRVVRALTRGRVMRVRTRDGVLEFRLTGTFRAITRLSECVASQLAAGRKPRGGSAFAGALRGGGNAFASASRAERNPAPGTTAHQRIDRAEATVFVTNLLSRAGITGYRIIPPAQYQKYRLSNFDVLWQRADGIYGGFNGLKNMQHLDLDREGGRLISNAAASCKGDLASGKKRAAAKDGVEIRRIFAACRNSETDFEIHYTLVKTAGGTVIQLAHAILSRPEDGQDQVPLAEADNSLIQTANWSQLD